MSSSTAEDELIKAVVAAAFPDDTELLGDAVVDQAVSLRNDPAVPLELDGGHDFDLKVILEIVKAAIELSVALIALYRTQIDKGSKPTAEEMVSQIPQKFAKSRLKHSDKLRIAEEVRNETGRKS
jgi:hypothetical protein